MPGATPVLGLPYPYLDEGISDASFSALANAVDAILAGYATRRDALLHRPSAAMYGTSTVQNTAAGTTNNLTFDTTVWDSTGSMVSMPNGITIPADGIYFASGTCNFDNSWTTYTSTRCLITQAGSGVGSHKLKATSFGEYANVMVLFSATAGQLIRLQNVWTGTGTVNVRFPALNVAQVFAF